jgi:hypothetical protein
MFVMLATMVYAVMSCTYTGAQHKKTAEIVSTLLNIISAKSMLIIGVVAEPPSSD